jgi:hypothetical protein
MCQNSEAVLVVAVVALELPGDNFLERKERLFNLF